MSSSSFVHDLRRSYDHDHDYDNLNDDYHYDYLPWNVYLDLPSSCVQLGNTLLTRLSLCVLFVPLPTPSFTLASNERGTFTDPSEGFT